MSEGFLSLNVGNTQRMELSRKAVQESIASIIFQNVMKCATSSVQSQQINFEDIEDSEINIDEINIQQVVESIGSQKCVQEATNSAEISREIKDDLDAKMAQLMANSGFLDANLMGSQSQKTNLETIQKIITDLNFSNVVECTLNNVQTQLINFQRIKGSTINIKKIQIEQTIQQTIKQECLQKSSNASEIIDKLQAQTAVEMTQEQGSMPWWMLLLIIAAIVVLLIVAARMAKKTPEAKVVDTLQNATT